MEKIFSWIHLADIHVGRTGADDGWDARRAWQALRHDLTVQSRYEKRQPDAVFVTGDITAGGKPSQYEQALGWLLELGGDVGLGAEQIFTVPGNHDVDRGLDESPDRAGLLRALRRGASLDEALQNPWRREELVARMGAYLDFSTRLGPSSREATPLVPGESLCWQHSLRVGALGLRVIGLNTALLCADDADRGQLALGQLQCQEVLAGGPPAADELVIALGHHPIAGGWLRDERAGEAWLRSHAHVYLFGHIHERAAEDARAGVGTSVLRIAAGVTRRPHSATVPAGCGYSTGELLVDAYGGLHVRVWPRFRAPGERGFGLDEYRVPLGQSYVQHTLGFVLSGSGATAARRAVEGSARSAAEAETSRERPLRRRSARAATADEAPSRRDTVPLGPAARAAREAVASSASAGAEPEGAGRAAQAAAVASPQGERGSGGERAVLGDRYQLLERIGQEQCAIVYRARDLAHGDEVAVKLLRPEVAERDEQRRRYFRGVRIMAALAHPSIAQIITPEQSEGRMHYMVTELVRGGTLHDAVLARKVVRADVLPLLLCLADAMAQAHLRGLVHGAIMPKTVLLTEQGAPRLTDFALMRALDGEDPDGRQAGGDLSVFLYTPPELIDEAGAPGARADVYGLGMTALFILHQAPLPMRALTARESFLANLECEPALRAVIARAVALSPAKRFADAGVLLEALEGISGDELSFEVDDFNVGPDTVVQRDPAAVSHLLAGEPSGATSSGQVNAPIEAIDSDEITEPASSAATTQKMQVLTRADLALIEGLSDDELEDPVVEYDGGQLGDSEFGDSEFDDSEFDDDDTDVRFPQIDIDGLSEDDLEEPVVEFDGGGETAPQPENPIAGFAIDPLGDSGDSDAVDNGLGDGPSLAPEVMLPKASSLGLRDALDASLEEALAARMDRGNGQLSISDPALRVLPDGQGGLAEGSGVWDGDGFSELDDDPELTPRRLRRPRDTIEYGRDDDGDIELETRGRRSRDTLTSESSGDTLELDIELARPSSSSSSSSQRRSRPDLRRPPSSDTRPPKRGGGGRDLDSDLGRGAGALRDQATLPLAGDRSPRAGRGRGVAQPEPAADAVLDPSLLIQIEAGTFTMGSADGDRMAFPHEKPAHEVELAGFYCMSVPVTRALWAEVMDEDSGWWPDGPADQHPVNEVSWLDAVEFCNALSEREGHRPCYRVDGDDVEWIADDGYRLPTEAEWEYACRASTQSRWSCGDEYELLREYGWFQRNTSAPREVGLKRPNRWGLYDMHGNLWEWCWDWYGAYDDPAPPHPVNNPRGPTRAGAIKLSRGPERILRGGSFADEGPYLRSALRNWATPAHPLRNAGFRCVRGWRRPGW